MESYRVKNVFIKPSSLNTNEEAFLCFSHQNDKVTGLAHSKNTNDGRRLPNLSPWKDRAGSSVRQDQSLIPVLAFSLNRLMGSPRQLPHSFAYIHSCVFENSKWKLPATLWKGCRAKSQQWANQKSQESSQTALALFQMGTKLFLSLPKSSYGASDKESCFSVGSRLSETHDTAQSCPLCQWHTLRKPWGFYGYNTSTTPQRSPKYYLGACFALGRDERFHENKIFMWAKRSTCTTYS